MESATYLGGPVTGVEVEAKTCDLWLCEQQLNSPLFPAVQLEFVPALVDLVDLVDLVAEQQQ